MEDKEYEEDIEIATIMNDHFQSVFTDESDMGEEDGLISCTEPLENVETTVLEIKKFRLSYLEVEAISFSQKIWKPWLLK